MESADPFNFPRIGIQSALIVGDNPIVAVFKR